MSTHRNTPAGQPCCSPATLKWIVAKDRPPIVLHHTLVPDAFMWLWAKYVHGVNDQHHCTHVLRGRYSRLLSKHNPALSRKHRLVLDEQPAGSYFAIYICGVAKSGYRQGRNYSQNLHAVVIPSPGSRDTLRFDKWRLTVENGKFSGIPEAEELDGKYRRLSEAHTTCRIFRWAVCVGLQMEKLLSDLRRAGGTMSRGKYGWTRIRFENGWHYTPEEYPTGGCMEDDALTDWYHRTKESACESAIDDAGEEAVSQIVPVCLATLPTPSDFEDYWAEEFGDFDEFSETYVDFIYGLVPPRDSIEAHGTDCTVVVRRKAGVRAHIRKAMAEFLLARYPKLARTMIATHRS